MKKVPPVINLIGKDENRTSRTVRHLGIMCKYHDWADVIGDLVTCFCGKQGRAIIFASTKKDTSDLALSDTISDAQMIHGDIEQKTREQTLKAFRDGKMRTLVATDVAARGLDIPEVDLVIQTNPPSDVDSYIHVSFNNIKILKYRNFLSLACHSIPPFMKKYFAAFWTYRSCWS